MNKKGQTLGIAIMSAIIFFIIGLTAVNFLFDEVDTARANLNCANADAISDGTKLLCLGIDTTVIYFMVGIFAVAGGAVTSRFIG